MLLRFEQLSKYRIEAIDGPIGHVNSFLFDDQRWIIRYLVVSTGTWLTGREVLIAPSALGKPEADGLPVKLTRDQIRNSPDILTHKPVSRQEEIDLYQYYGWAPYWDAHYDPLAAPYIPVIEPSIPEKPADETADPHLRSTKKVIGYKIHAQDGQIGHVEDFLIDDENWIIRYLIVDTRDWLPGKKVLLPPDWIKEISWSVSEVAVNVRKETVKDSPEYNPKFPPDREYEARLYDYYGWSKYWQ